MNEAAKIVNGAILGFDAKTVIVKNRAYVVSPPTIERIAGASYYLSDFSDDMANNLKNVESAANALSWFVCKEKGTHAEMVAEAAKTAERLKKGNLTEIVEALGEAYSLIDIKNFLTLSALMKSATMLTARAK